MYEIEIKAYCNDLSLIENELELEKALFVGEYKQHDIYYNHPLRDFKETDEAFRIRSVDGNQFVTYKGPKISQTAKTRIELETSIGEFETFRSILLSLGFKEGGEVIKIRKEYILNNVTICLDNVYGAGSFVEFEIMGSDIAKGEQALFEMGEHLGLRRFERKSYLELVLG